MVLKKPRGPSLLLHIYNEQQKKLQAIVDGIMEIQSLCKVRVS